MDAALFFDLDAFDFDISIASGAIVEEFGLESAILLSIFTDRRAADDDELPGGSGPGFADRRGWWGDTYPDVEGDRIGSRLWLLGREKATSETLARGKEFVREALLWLVEDGVASRVDVEAEWLVRTADKVATFRATIQRPDAPEISFRFQYAWEGV